MSSLSVKHVVVGLAALLFVASAGCGGDDGGGAAAGPPDDGGPTTAAPAQPPDESSDECPLHAEQVSDAVGVAVAEDPALACSFNPPDALAPSVQLVRQLAAICSDGAVSDLLDTGYEPFEGLPVDAYLLADAGPAVAQLVSCTDAPFEIIVDIVPDTADITADPETAGAAALVAETAAAEALARQVLADEG